MSNVTVAPTQFYCWWMFIRAQRQNFNVKVFESSTIIVKCNNLLNIFKAMQS